jgi:hypothetical protein
MNEIWKYMLDLLAVKNKETNESQFQRKVEL